MNRMTATLSLAAAFAAGCGVTHLLQPGRAAAETITAQIIHTRRLLTATRSAPANAGGMRTKMFVSADGATISIQDGNVRKHLHPNANEIQYILEGTGTIWLGDKEVQVKPGDLVIIPKGTAAWRHQARRPHLEGDRDQDAAAGAGRHQAAELTAGRTPSFPGAARSSRDPESRDSGFALRAPRNDGPTPAPPPRPAARPAAAARPASRRDRSG